MKNVLILILSFCLLLTISCAKKEKHENENAAGNWKELDAFHEVMAASFHPLMDSGNVEPAKKRINEMADEAAKWAASELPEKVNNQDMKFKLEKLKADSRSLADEIKNGATDEVIKQKLTDLHKQFHHISEAWSDKPEKEEEHKH